MESFKEERVGVGGIRIENVFMVVKGGSDNYVRRKGCYGINKESFKVFFFSYLFFEEGREDVDKVAI